MNRFLPGLRAGVIASCVLALGLAVPACDNGPELAQTLQLSAPTTNLLVGQTTQITATVLGKKGQTLTDRLVSYQSTAPNVLTVGSEGLVAAITPGAATVTATVDGVSQRLSFVVAPVPVARVAMSRDTASIAAATSLQLTATPQDSAGRALNDRAVTWSTSDANVATVSGVGLVTAVAVGTATITATSENKTGQTRITVTPAAIVSIEITPSPATVVEGRTVQLSATPRDALGRALTGRRVSWISSDVTKATVDTTGLVRGVAPGSANILVTSGSVFASVAVLVTPVVIGSVVLSPDSAAILRGATVRFSATVRDAGGVLVTNKPVTWSSLDQTIATVDTTGLVTGVGIGRARVVATVQNRADTAIVSVSGPPLSSISLVPSPAALGLGRSGRLTAIARDAAGNLIDDVAVEFSTDDSTIVEIDSTGVLTGASTGTTNVYGRSGGRLARVTFTVVPTPVEGLTLAASALALGVGDTAQIAVTVYDLAGAVAPNRLVSYASEDPSVVKVGPTGLVTAIGTGTGTIRVTSEGKSATIDFTVQ